MTTDALLDDLIRREGGFVNNVNDKGFATNYGITSRTLGEWRGLGRPASVAEVKALDEKEARAIYTARYVQPFRLIPFDELRAHLVDIGVQSGPVAAIEMLQQVLGVPVDGMLGPRTLAALGVLPWRVVNDAIVAHRVRFYRDLVKRDPTQSEFSAGWLTRTLEFLS